MFHRFLPILLVISVLILAGVAFASSKQWFFTRTGQHDIGKMGLSGQYDHNATLATFRSKDIVAPPYIEAGTKLAEVLGKNINANKRIEVDITNQKLYAYDNGRLVYSFTVSTGNPWTPTPTGEFKTWIKLRYQRMEGGSRALGTYYNLPNVPHIMYFYNQYYPRWQGYGIHGAYWHNNFGHPMSHGCINMKLPDAEALYNWAGVGTKVVIYGSTPR